jgi:hypothetical protein
METDITLENDDEKIIIDRHLRQAQNRYRQVYDDSATIEQTTKN